MARMIIAGTSEEKRGQMARLLASSGYTVHRSCESGSALRRAIAESEDCLVIMMGLLPDCRPDDLVWDYGDRVQILLIARQETLENLEAPEIFHLTIPTTGHAILGAVEMLQQMRGRRMPKRRGPEKETVEQAKELLMLRHGITEPEAHRMMQKYAMDHGMRMTDCAARILSMAGEQDLL